MAAGRVQAFSAMRPHQRPAWHMFLTQLGALAAWTAQWDDLPQDEGQWATALRALTPQWTQDEPWRLFASTPERPAFLQPPAPDGLQWRPVATPDAIDMLVSARNHDLKREVNVKSTVEEWVYALVSKQTCEGYSGRGNHGIARMNGGVSSRVMLGLAPGRGGRDQSVDPSAWWRRDVKRLLGMRREGNAPTVGAPGGPALLWCLDWPEDEQLEVDALDPWFIEVCRRIRLHPHGGTARAERATSKAPRIRAKARKGNLGDPWAPIHKAEGKALTLAGRGFSHARLTSLLFGEDWEVPPLARPAAGEGDMVLVAEAFSRGNGKTEGFKSRCLPVPRGALAPEAAESAGACAMHMGAEVKAADAALRNALALAAAHGDPNAVSREHFDRATPARRQLDRAVDRIYFPSLWQRMEAAAGQGEDAKDAALDAKRTFLRNLQSAAKSAFEEALPSVARAGGARHRTEVRARRRLFLGLRRSPAFASLFEDLDSEGGRHANP